MRYLNVPSAEEVAATLSDLGGRSTAKSLCDALTVQGRPRADSQLGIQRATCRGHVAIAEDWTMVLPADGGLVTVR